MNNLNRRTFIASTAAALPLGAVSETLARDDQPEQIARPGKAMAISSANGLPAVNKAVAMMNDGTDPAEAIVAGVTDIENDPEDTSVGYGGLPNEQGVVQLDSSVMHGPMHKAGAVAALEKIRNPAQVALQVLRRTDHVLVVGEGALAFAKAMGYQEENLFTEKARKIWLQWKQDLNPNDDWLDSNQQILQNHEKQIGAALGQPSRPPFEHGTVHVSGVDPDGNVAGCTSTSGLPFKLPGRVGDSPIIGAGMYVDNDVGAAGATGRGESLMQSCGAFQIVRDMSDGIEPQQACLKLLKWIADHTKRPSLLNEKDEPNFNATVYAIRKDGAYGSATMRGRASFVIHDGTASRYEKCVSLFQR